MLSQGLGVSVVIATEINRSSLLAGSGWILVAGLSSPGLTTRVAAPVAVAAAGRVVVSGPAAASTAVPAPVAAIAAGATAAVAAGAAAAIVAGAAVAVAPGAADGPVAGCVAHGVAWVTAAARHLGVVEGGRQT